MKKNLTLCALCLGLGFVGGVLGQLVVVNNTFKEIYVTTAPKGEVTSDFMMISNDQGITNIRDGETLILKVDELVMASKSKNLAFETVPGEDFPRLKISGKHGGLTIILRPECLQVEYDGEVIYEKKKHNKKGLDERTTPVPQP